ncbi:porin [Solimicrobium silvestre]|uniref:Gram-negative porin n=1 Tax=Solimicrobium silvestre TaxID=2099400 RepID=A0A2S9GYJ1_9BURK|nr:porin [Solimicrobium silvestre]PRC92781.1 Gram-negative porin [Solimicrobium silvestre]
MKKNVLFTLIAMLAASSAFAQQSPVTVYGLIDAAFRSGNNYETGVGNAVGTQTGLNQGALHGSRLGFKGDEDLGGGTSVVFDVEMGLVIYNGTSDQQGQLFGRQAYVGLKNKEWGELYAGRQNGLAFDIYKNYDPIGVGNSNEDSWEDTLWGLRFDNTLKYKNSWGPVKAEVQYTAGGAAGSTTIGTTDALALTYATGPFSASVLDQHSTDANSKVLNVVGFGSSFVVGPTTLLLDYFTAKRDAGFAKAASLSGGSLANTSLMGNAGNTLQRTDSVWTAGLMFKPTPVMVYTVGYMTDNVTNDSSTGNSGKVSTGYGLVEYYVTKRTEFYGMVDYTKVSGGEIDNGTQTNTVLQFSDIALGGNTSRTGFTVGICTKF